MKNLKTTFIAALALLTFACSQKPAIDYTLLSGKLENYSSGELTVMRPDRSKIEIAVAEDGTFADTLFDKGELYLIFGKAGTKFYAMNGAELIVSADVDKLTESIVITGKKSGMSNYVLTKYKQVIDENKTKKDLYMKGETEYMLACREKQTQLEAELAKYPEIPEELVSLEKRSLKAAYVSALISYPSYHAHYTDQKDFEASEELVNASKDLDYNDELLYEYSAVYRGVLTNFYTNKAKDLVEKDEALELTMAKLLVAEKIENKTIREAIMFDAVANSFARADNKKELYEKYMAVATDEEKKTKVTENFEIVSKLDKGNPSPKFVGFENYAGGTSSLDDFKGKYVYIDVWATWCGPCKGEIPHLQKIEKQYHGKNIEFISISTDNENRKQAWKDMIAEKQMGGVQLITHERDFMDAYIVTGIPRFILIDPQGNIVDKDAPRPSSKKLIELFNELNL